MAGNPGERQTGLGLGFAAGSAEKAPYEVGRRGGETSAHVGMQTAETYAHGRLGMVGPRPSR